jgi:hypothetical protein
VNASGFPTFYAFAMEASAGTLIGPAFQTFITLVKCQDGKLEVRGLITNEVANTVTIYPAAANGEATGDEYGTAAIDPFDPVAGNSPWKFKNSNIGNCPTHVKAVSNDGSSAVASVPAAVAEEEGAEERLGLLQRILAWLRTLLGLNEDE